MNLSSEDGRYSVRAVERALQIVGCIARHPAPPTVDDIVTATRLPKTTVFRVLATLVAGRFLTRDDAGQTYRFGELAMLVGARALGDLDLQRIAHPLLEELVRLTGETVHLSVLSDGAALCIDKIDSPRSVRMLSFVGFRDPLHCSGVGKTLLAFQPPEARKSLLAAMVLDRRTGRTITERGALETHLAEIRRDGFALDRGEVEEDLVCVAAPVFGHRGEPVAAISASGPAARLDDGALGRVIETVIDHARRISLALGNLQEAGRT